MACSDELAAELDAEILGNKRARTDDYSSRQVDEELIQKVVDTALRREKEQRAGDWLANLEQIDNDLRNREATIAIREDAMVGRERAVMIEEEKNKDTAAELKDIETTLEERAKQGWAQSWDEQQWQKEKELVVREDAQVANVVCPDWLWRPWASGRG